MRLRLIASLGLAAVIAALAMVSASARGTSVPHIHEMQYGTDTEARPFRNLIVWIKGGGHDTTVKGLFGDEKASAKLIAFGPMGRGWSFGDRSFVRSVRDSLVSTGTADVIVKAVGETGQTRVKLCSLVYEPDPVFGEAGEGECHQGLGE